MRIRLINIDSIIPNLALMQLSTYHKSIGDEVGFDVNNPDRVYVSCLFQKNAGLARGMPSMFPDSEVILGGSGFYNMDDLHNELFTRTIPLDAQKVIPDYSLYPDMDYDLGFTTRGCFRNCPFCIVKAKEGNIQKWQHISEFHDPTHTEVHLLDNNIYGIKDWFFDNTEYVIENDLKLKVHPGFDIRIITEEIATQLKRVKWGSNMLNFAWDNFNEIDENKVIRGIEILKQAGFNLRSQIGFYVLTGFNTTPFQDLYRCRKLKGLGVNAFVMQYTKTPFTNHLARWSNRRQLYWSMDFKDYTPAKGVYHMADTE